MPWPRISFEYIYLSALTTRIFAFKQTVGKGHSKLSLGLLSVYKYAFPFMFMCRRSPEVDWGSMVKYSSPQSIPGDRCGGKAWVTASQSSTGNQQTVACRVIHGVFTVLPLAWVQI
jgi:hypothetical protein